MTEVSWEAAVERILPELASIESPDLLLVFIDSAFAANYQEITDRLREATGTAHLIGASGQSVIGSSIEAEDGHAIAVLAMQIPGASVDAAADRPEQDQRRHLRGARGRA